MSSCILLFLFTGLEDGEGDVLVEVQLRWSSSSSSTSDATAASHSPPLLLASEQRPVYAGARVLRIEAHARGGALVQLASGRMLRYTPSSSTTTTTMNGSGTSSGSLKPCPTAAHFPSPCMWLRPVPSQQLTSDEVPPAVGLNVQGALYYGASLLASSVTSCAVRASGAGGSALLFTTRKSHMYTVLFSELAKGHTHVDLTAVGHKGPRK